MILKRLGRFGRIYGFNSKHFYLLLVLLIGFLNVIQGLTVSSFLKRLDTFAQRRFSNATYSGNPLWTELIDKCGTSTSFSCVQNSIFNYLDSKLLNSNFFVTDGIYFIRNSNNFGVESLSHSNVIHDRDYHSSFNSSNVNIHSISNLRPISKFNSINDTYSSHENISSSPFTPSSINSIELDSSTKSGNHAYEIIKSTELPTTVPIQQTTTPIYFGDLKTRQENETTKEHDDLQQNVTVSDSSKPQEDFPTTEDYVYEKAHESDSDFNDFVNSVEEAENTIGSGENDQPKKGETHSFDGNDQQYSSHRSIDDLSDILYNKGLKYLMTHDLQVHLPQMVFGGGRLKISPKGFDEDGGAIIKLNVDPEEKSESRLFKKFIQSMFKKKLMSSFMALMLILKLLKIKLMFLLPLIVGVGTAKKILLKVLLFLFPALSHLFKLCSYYHHHAAKYHLHHHKVKHHHHHIPVPVPVPSPPKHVYHHHHSPAPTYEEPEYPIPPPPHHGGFPDSHELSDPTSFDSPEFHGAGPYFPRNDVAANTVQQHSDEFESWGLNELFSNTESPGVYSAVAQSYAHLYNPQYPAAASANSPAAPVAQVPPPSVPSSYYQGSSNEKHFNTNYKVTPSKSSYFTSKPTGLASYYSNGNDFATRYATTPAPISTPLMHSYDSFYSPILDKIDAVLIQMGITDEPCKERVICSMYKTPVRFSPHSNLLSAELSRDPAELQRPAYSNAAVVRFYKYVQAARDGQDYKDCLKLYPSCGIKTE